MTRTIQLLILLALFSVITTEYCAMKIDARMGYGSIRSDESNCELYYKVHNNVTKFMSDHTPGFTVSFDKNTNTIYARRGQDGRGETASFVWKSQPQHTMKFPVILYKTNKTIN